MNYVVSRPAPSNQIHSLRPCATVSLTRLMHPISPGYSHPDRCCRYIFFILRLAVLSRPRRGGPSLHIPTSSPLLALCIIAMFPLPARLRPLNRLCNISHVDLPGSSLRIVPRTNSISLCFLTVLTRGSESSSSSSATKIVSSTSPSTRLQCES